MFSRFFSALRTHYHLSVLRHAAIQSSLSLTRLDAFASGYDSCHFHHLIPPSSLKLDKIV